MIDVTIQDVREWNATLRTSAPGARRAAFLRAGYFRVSFWGWCRVCFLESAAP
jgi:hypothetical protein